MSNQNFFQKFTSLYTDKSINGWVRGLMFVGTGIVIYSVGRTAYNKLFPSAAAQAAAKALANLDNSISNDIANGVTQSFPTPNYDDFANTIYQSGGWKLGIDDDDTIVSILKKMQNNLDVELLTKAFGTRPAHKYLGISTGSDKDLFSFLASTIGNEYLGFWQQRDDVNQDWTSKGITYQL